MKFKLLANLFHTSLNFFSSLSKKFHYHNLQQKVERDTDTPHVKFIILLLILYKIDLQRNGKQ